MTPAAQAPSAGAAHWRFIGTAYRRFEATDTFDVVVIGSGIGGLGTAALLAKIAGLRVLVLERHYTAGGFTHVFHRPGFEWDVGVHYVGQVHQKGSQAAALFDYVTEDRLSWSVMPTVYDRIEIDGVHFDYVAGERRLRAALLAAFPRESQAIDRYFGLIHRVIRRSPFFFTEKALPPFLGRLVGAGLRAPFLALARRTTADVLAELDASPELKAVLTGQWVDYGLPPAQSSFAVHAIVAHHYIDGAAYPVGGASRIAAAIVPIIERSGGRVVVDATVASILFDGSRAIGVRMGDGREIRAASIVSDAGFGGTLALLPRGASPQFERVAERVQVIPPSPAHLCLYVGVSASAFTRLPDPANRFIHPSVDFDRNWNAFASSLDAPFPVLYISFPSLKDPTFEQRYPGHHTIEMVVPAPYDAFATWSGSRWKHRGAEYEAMKKVLAERLLAALYRHVPELKGPAMAWELSTPLSTEHFTNAPRGASYGLACTPARFALRDLQPRTPIHNLFLTGQDTATLGVLGALFGAVTTTSVMLRKNIFGLVTRAAAGLNASRRAADTFHESGTEHS